jgi:hypothetical protein
LIEYFSNAQSREWYCVRDLVKKIAVYKDKLAVQLPNKVVIYELANPGEAGRQEVKHRHATGSEMGRCEMGDARRACSLNPHPIPAEATLVNTTH